jgi:ketosteroid isomerase-like protein
VTFTYADGGALLERYVAARTGHHGDDWVALFTAQAELRLDPFADPLVGHNALRAYLNEAAEAETNYEMTIERHWVAGDTLLAAWHASWASEGSGARAHVAGVLAAETRDGAIVRLRQWWNAREPLAG